MHNLGFMHNIHSKIRQSRENHAENSSYLLSDDNALREHFLADIFPLTIAE